MKNIKAYEFNLSLMLYTLLGYIGLNPFMIMSNINIETLYIFTRE